MRILDVDEIKTVPYTPLSYPFVERLIGTIRREYLDHTLFWNAVDLERKLADFQAYYNHHRTHRSLGGDTPAEIAGGTPKLQTKLKDFRWQNHCRGIFQLPEAACVSIRHAQAISGHLLDSLEPTQPAFKIVTIHRILQSSP